MKKLMLICCFFFFAPFVSAGEMPGSTGPKTEPSLKDQIAFEEAKLVTYDEAMKISKGNKLPFVVCVGCYEDDIQLYLQLKGKVILCYLKAKTAPFPTLESGVVVGLWNSDASTCVRHDVSAYTFSDPKFREELISNKKVTTVVETYTLRSGVYYSNVTGQPLNLNGGTPWVVGTDCSSGKCKPVYGFR